MKGLTHVKFTLLKYTIIIMGKIYTTSLLASNKGANSCKIFPVTAMGENYTTSMDQDVLLASGVKFSLIVKYKIHKQQEFYK